MMCSNGSISAAHLKGMQLLSTRRFVSDKLCRTLAVVSGAEFPIIENF